MNILLAILSQIASVVGGGISGAFGILTSTMDRGFQSAIQFHKEGIAFARDVGLSAKQAQAYTNTLIERTQTLANKYGVSAEAIIQVQRNLSDATGKQLMLNNAQAEGFVQMNKLVGAQATSKFTEEIMNGMGGQIDTVNAAVAKTYATALKQGLNAKKLTDKVAQNLSMANRLSFRNGIEGITRMAAMSEKLGFNMQSVESAANNFLELDKAIENAAQMQMLGGSAAVNFGNPLTAAYEANYDPEAFAERMSNSLASYAEFDASKGIANINGMNMDFVRNIAKTMGISTEEASRMAKKQSEVRYKESKFSDTLKGMGLSEEQKNFLINNGQVRDGKLYYTDVNNKEHSLSDLKGEEGRKLLNQIMQFSDMSDTEILKNQAATLTSIDEQISGASASILAGFADGLEKYIPGLKDNVKAIGEFLKPYSKDWGKSVGNALSQILQFIQKNGQDIAKVASFLLGAMSSFIDLVGNNWKTAIALWGGWKLGKGVLDRLGGATTSSGAASGVRNLWGGIKKGGSALLTASQEANIATRLGYTELRNNGNGRVMSALKAPFKGFGALSTTSKLINVGASAVGVGLGAYQAITADNAADRGAGIGTALGAGIGTALGGPIGAAIGGFLGDFAGRFIGEHWDDITNVVSKAWDGITGAFSSVFNWFTEKGNWVADGILGVFMPWTLVIKYWDEIGKAVNNGWSRITNFFLDIGKGIESKWDAVCKIISKINPKNWFSSESTEKHAQGGIVGGNSPQGDKIITGLNSGEMVLNRTQQANLFNLINGLNGNMSSILENRNDVKAKPVGEKEYIYTPQRNTNSSPNETNITVKDINVNIGGTIKLDGGRYSKNVDVNELLNDMVFVSSLKEMIKESINRDMNGGLYNNDLASRRGGGAPLSIIGR